MSTPEKQSQKGLSSQKYLEIGEIKDNVVVMKNGSLRAVLMVSSINFALKSIDEQDAIIYRYQSFLNSLDFSIQIVVNSRQLNIDTYLDVLREEEKKQTNDLLRMQISSYIEYINGLVKMANIVTKTFYIVVPFSLAESKDGNIQSKLSSVTNAAQVMSGRQAFEKYRDQLFQRVDHIVENLSGAGLRMTMLNTQELIELYYSVYNPESVEKKGLADVEDIDLAQ
jgi:type IV secretory pathway VirB4 component